jgi:glucose-1-phosphatase
MGADAYLAGFGERIGYPLSRAQWVEARRLAMTPFADMLALVASLKQHIPVAVLTNNGFLTKQTIGELFPQLPALFAAGLRFTAEFGARKPDREVYLRFLAKLGVAPQAALMVDDDVMNVRGAEAAGLHGHLFNGRAGLVDRLESFGIRAA